MVNESIKLIDVWSVVCTTAYLGDKFTRVKICMLNFLWNITWRSFFLDCNLKEYQPTKQTTNKTNCNGICFNIFGCCPKCWEVLLKLFFWSLLDTRGHIIRGCQMHRHFLNEKSVPIYIFLSHSCTSFDKSKADPL